MNLLFTGALGFLGENTIPHLGEYTITTLGLEPANDCVVNLAKEIPSLPHRYDIVLHAAGKAHVVPQSKAEEQLFYDINLQGTKHLCSSLEAVGVPQSFVFISTVAVYGLEIGDAISEATPTHPTTPYGDSKLQAEIFLTEWAEKNGVALIILRPSLLAGRRPPGNLGAMIAGIASGKYLSIGNASAKKSILMAEDLATLVKCSSGKSGVYNVCSQTTPTFKELEQSIANQLGIKAPLSIPYFVAKLLALVGDMLGRRAPINSSKLTKITSSLTFDSSKAQQAFDWKPLDIIEHFKIK